MSMVAEPVLDRGALIRILRDVDSRVCLIPARVLRRVIRGIMGVGGLGKIPHRGGFAERTEVVLRYANRLELGLELTAPDPDHVILLPEPENKERALSTDALLLHYWRLLFHARVHLSFDTREEEFPPEGTWIADRVARLGRLVLVEARAVLYEDQFLAVPADDRATYVEFAAVYLELFAFHRELISHTFPGILDHQSVQNMLLADVDLPGTLEATRPEGAPETPTAIVHSEDETEDDDSGEFVAADDAEEPEPGRWSWLKRLADMASQRGNRVRAAILRVRAAKLAPPIEAQRTRAGAKSELGHLTRRLRAALGFDGDESSRWKKALAAFLDGASTGLWPRPARMLYDLQKVCSDHERQISRTDLLGWLISRGKRPIRIPLPDHRLVLMLSHLRSASARLARMHGPEPQRTQLAKLVDDATRREERELRETFRSRFHRVFDEVGFVPANLPERAARRKLIEELIDLVIERGYLRLGDLRDALSRNQIKLPDLASGRELVAGDPLLRADVALAKEFDGVYHRGEIYLRALQRTSSLAFGTHYGRLFTKYFALPFGGAFIMLEGLQHILGALLGLLLGEAPHLMNPVSYTIVALLLLGIINRPGFRGIFFSVCSKIGVGLRVVFYTIPRWILDRPVFHEFLNNRWTVFGWNWLVKPLFLVGVLSLCMSFLIDEHVGAMLRVVAFVAISLFINSRQGRLVEEIASDGATRVGQRVWRDFLPNVFQSVMGLFKAILELFERLIYSVDEWARFRSGESKFTLGAKAVFGLAWFVVAYVARIYITLLIEPQINPIKHFPVVTVSHKIMLPMSVTVFKLLKAPLVPLGEGIANTFAGATLFLIPGLFGFLVWELKENWRLYAANRAKTLTPVMIGHHGETMSRFLRRGFHSGTIPKLYAKLRRKDYQAEHGASEAESRKAEESLHHVARSISQFVDRSVIYLLDGSEAFALAGPSPKVAAVRCTTNRVVVSLHWQGIGHEPPAEIAFEESERRLFARVLVSGWIGKLEPEAHRAILSAMAGLFSWSDVELIGDPGDDKPDPLTPPIEWDQWVSTWEGDANGRGHQAVVPENSPILTPTNV